MEGQRFDFRCEYSDGLQTNAKYFCHDDNNVPSCHLIRTGLPDKWVKDERFSLYDNTTGAYFTVKVEKLSLKDSGKYWCGVDTLHQSDNISAVELNVLPGTARQGHYLTARYAHFIRKHTVKSGF